MARTFQRMFGPERSLTPGQYTVETATRRPALCCPACALIYDLPAGIQYDISGHTNYEVRCNQTSCGWKEYAVLDSIWEEP